MYIAAFAPPIALATPITGFFGLLPVIDAFPLGGAAPPADPGVGYAI